jgi:hypothetical protein
MSEKTPKHNHAFIQTSRVFAAFWRSAGTNSLPEAYSLPKGSPQFLGSS